MSDTRPSGTGCTHVAVAAIASKPSAASLPATSMRRGRHGAKPEHHRVATRAVLGENVEPTLPAKRGDRRAERALGVAHNGRRVRDVDRFAERRAQRRLVPGRREAQPRNVAQQRHVPHAVVARAVVAGDPRAIEHERHARVVQRNIHEHLVERAIEEGCVNGEDRVHPGEREARRRRHRMLLGDAHVDDAVGVLARERAKANGLKHRRRDRHDVVALGADRDHLVGKDAGPAKPRRLDRQTRLRVNLAHGVEAIRVVLLRRRVAAALVREHVHDRPERR